MSEIGYPTYTAGDFLEVFFLNKKLVSNGGTQNYVNFVSHWIWKYNPGRHWWNKWQWKSRDFRRITKNLTYWAGKAFEKLGLEKLYFFTFWELVTHVFCICIVCSSLNTFSPVSYSPKILSWTILRGMPCSSAVGMQGTFRTPSPLFIMFSVSDIAIGLLIVAVIEVSMFK